MKSRMFVAPEQLEAFEFAARTGSFSAAARHLGKAQSTISGLISNMEIDTGLVLFDRSRREPVLTAAGESLLQDVRALLNSYSRFEAKSESLTSGVEESLTLAVDEAAISFDHLTACLLPFRRQFSTVSVNLLHATGEQAENMIRSREADIGIILSQSDYPDEFDFRGAGQCSSRLITGANHPLAKLGKVTIDDLRDHLHLRTSSEAERNKLPESDLSDRRWYVENHTLLIELVAMGLGWAFAPSHIAQPHIASGKVVELPSEFQLTPFPYCTDLIWSRRKVLGPAGQMLLEQLSDILAENSTAA
ncbi:LysR family transcriptional regulator [Biformimicrobium ophioploci]|uniref:LysR family transcriptional regulator n=1 Tax=Biformimicrobium ophioploci TaxID=3036711 RepID=A0ABQ6LXK8_9GAMM|nr:LysR family transcriptional regulator [Microbulbifer sp. NKW57]GMG86757.1 LysR family transcriptional regulator [Microbulbifer sp. NKW57]